MPFTLTFTSYLRLTPLAYTTPESCLLSVPSPSSWQRIFFFSLKLTSNWRRHCMSPPIRVNLSHVAIGMHIKPPINCRGPWRPGLSVQLSLYSRPKLYQLILSSIHTNSINFHLLCMCLFHFGSDRFLIISSLNSSR